MHPHSVAFATPVSGVRRNAPSGPDTKRLRELVFGGPRYLVLNAAGFDYWRKYGVPPPISGGANLLVGDASTFEASTGSWQSLQNTLTSSTDQAQAGTHSLKCVRLTAGGAWVAFSAAVDITGGAFYTGSAYVRAGTTTRAPWVSIVFYESDGTTIVGQETSGALVAELNTAWTRAIVTAGAPSNAAKARLIVNYANSATGEVHYVDTAVLDTTPTTGGSIIDVDGNSNPKSWHCPSIATHGYDVIEVSVECWGSGGDGGNGNALAGGGGGGGGAYSKETAFTTTPNTIYPVQVSFSATDTWFNSAATVMAKAGVVGVAASGLNTPGGGGAGGAAGSGVGDTKFSGGAGAAGTTLAGGGGGGGSGSTASGNAAVGQTGGTGGAGNPFTGNGGAGPLTGTGAQGDVWGGGGAGGGILSGVGGLSASGLVRINPTKFRVTSPIIHEHVPALTRRLVAARSFAIITEHVTTQGARSVIKTPFSVITEHVTTQGAKSIVKTAFNVITEHVPAMTRRLLAFRSFAVTHEHVTDMTRRLNLFRTFPVIQEHVTVLTRRLVATRSFGVITEHDVALTRRFVGSRTFAVIQEHEAALTRRLVASRSFSTIQEHVTTFSRQLNLSRNFDVITEHVMDFNRIVTFDRRFFNVHEHVVTARVCMDFDDVPEQTGGTTIIKKFFPVFDEF